MPIVPSRFLTLFRLIRRVYSLNVPMGFYLDTQDSIGLIDDIGSKGVIFCVSWGLATK
jgi:hypothetical protein